MSSDADDLFERAWSLSAAIAAAEAAGDDEQLAELRAEQTSLREEATVAALDVDAALKEYAFVQAELEKLKPTSGEQSRAAIDSKISSENRVQTWVIARPSIFRGAWLRRPHEKRFAQDERDRLKKRSDELHSQLFTAGAVDANGVPIKR